MAVRDDEKIVPICDHIRHRWMLSEIQVRESLLAKSIESEADRKRAAETMPDGGKWSELIILEPEERGCWSGSALNTKGDDVGLAYGLRTGLTVLERRG
jgi:hypothetical protein